MRLGVRAGDGCAALHDRMMRDLRVNLLEFDEVWSFIGKKQKRLGPDDLREKGDCYIFTALSATHKAIVSYQIGKRSGANANAFAMDVRQRVLGRPQISSDGFSPYIDAIERAFGSEVDYGQIVKVYAGESGPDTARRYSPGIVVDVRKAVIAGGPDRKKISTSFVERSNLTIRMQCRRLTRRGLAIRSLTSPHDQITSHVGDRDKFQLKSRGHHEELLRHVHSGLFIPSNARQCRSASWPATRLDAIGSCAIIPNNLIPGFENAF
jgi:IS1 family transposase